MDDPKFESIEQLRDALRAFAAERDWDQFHSPKNLVMALNVEAGELLEHFQWLTEQGSRTLAAPELAAVSLECADVFIYLVRSMRANIRPMRFGASCCRPISRAECCRR
jgi:NTP pyrophosphatase (non-canonical NTP hydrolase)